MKKLHKIITLCLALVMLLGIMAVPASAAWDYMYVVWTEDEVWDLSKPRPVAPDNTLIFMYVVTKGNEFDTAKAEDMDNGYRGDIRAFFPTFAYNGNMNSKPEVQAAAKEAYNRITDAEYKAIIADVFGLETGSDDATETTPATTTPETPVTPPVTTTPTATANVTGFSDVKKGDWYYEAVMALANSGILAGYADGTFRPNNTITVGELATILCRVEGIDLSTPVSHPRGTHHGHDDSTVNAGHWAETAMAYMRVGTSNGYPMCIANMEVNRGWAIAAIANKLIVATWPDGRTLPTANENRVKEILATIPDIAADYVAGCDYGKYTEDKSHYPDYRLRQLPDLPLAKTGEEVIERGYVTCNGEGYSYDCDLSAWGPETIAQAYSIGLVNGVDSTGRCDPWAPITRAQVVQMLYNMGITQAGQLTPPDYTNDANANFAFGGSSSSK